MQKILFTILFLTLSSVVSAATVTLSPPELSNVPGTVITSSAGPNANITGDLVTGNYQFQGATPGSEYSATWLLIVDAPVKYEFDVGSLYGATASLFSGTTELFSGISIGYVTGTLSAGIYTILSEGFASRHGTGGIQFDLAVSEVPIPAAVWLFGSVLAGAAAMRRRNANKMTAVAA